MTQPTTHEALFIDELRGEARRYREFADQALAQVDDAASSPPWMPSRNSLALIVKHVAGNLRSRWTDSSPPTARSRTGSASSEFELEPGDTRAALMARWEAAWSCLLETLDRMTPEDCRGTVVIRAEPHTVTRGRPAVAGPHRRPRRPDRAARQARRRLSAGARSASRAASRSR
jgi:hypothetical protein